jgi:hypothetical protein
MSTGSKWPTEIVNIVFVTTAAIDTHQSGPGGSIGGSGIGGCCPGKVKTSDHKEDHNQQSLARK